MLCNTDVCCMPVLVHHSPHRAHTSCSDVTVINCSSTYSGAEEQATDEGPVAPWWESWDDVDVPSRKRKHPTSKPSAEDTQEDHGLASLSIQVVHSLRLWVITSCESLGGYLRDYYLRDC